jgi:hypothetical protein
VCSFRIRLGTGILLTIPLIATALLVWAIATVFPVSPDAAPGTQRTEQRPGFSLAPPEFLLRLGLLPAQARGRALIGVIVENHEAARPHQRGLEQALLIEEFLVEGMISRFLAFFDVNDLPPLIGPVRSLRPYFVEGSLPWTRVLVHAGGSPEALDRVAALSGVVTAINALRYDDGIRLSRLKGVPPPHDLFLPADELLKLLPADVPASLWPPYRTGAPRAASGATTIAITFYNPFHNVEYRLQQDGSYVRMNGGLESALQPRNVVVLAVPIEDVGEFGRLTITLKGEGKMFLFRSGRIYEGRWHKEHAEAPWAFLGSDGEPLTLATGATWITVVPDLTRVHWQ